MWRLVSQQPRPRRRAHRVALFGLAIIAACTPGDGDRVPDGWAAVDLAIANDNPTAPLTCQFLLAHWFEITQGPIAPGDEGRTRLFAHRESGEVALLNDVGDLMRLERIHCGAEGVPRNAWSGIAIDPLRRAAGPRRLACNQQGCSVDALRGE